jgi:hypothetical protein
VSIKIPFAFDSGLNFGVGMNHAKMHPRISGKKIFAHLKGKTRLSM